MRFSPQHIAETTNARIFGEPQGEIDRISTDSRSLHNNAHTLFVALKGSTTDGHHYIQDLQKQGVRHFLVTELPKFTEGAAFYLVGDTLLALQQLAADHRSKFNIPVIGITGSNGKTIVKEWLNFLLAPEYTIIRSPKSYNSQLGVPLSVLSINEQHTLGIFEAGISQPGEMTRLASILRPNIGIFTNLGTAHDEGFVSTQAKLLEKATLFSEVDICIHRNTVSIPCRSFTWGFEGDADVMIEMARVGPKTRFTATFGAQSFDAEIPFTDHASLENAATCLTTLLYLKYDPKTIAQRLGLLFPVQMRLQVKDGINGTTLIDDSYSSDFQSLAIALDFLESQHQHSKTLILSDIVQSGLPEEKLYQRVAEMVRENKITRVIGIGETLSKYASLFINVAVYRGTDAFLDDAANCSFANETILIKGARHFRFERIVRMLEVKTHETALEINLNAISHNLAYFRSKLAPGTRLMAMVKAFGYGSGSLELARLLEYHRVDYLGVAFADEGITLKNGGITLPVMVLNPETTSFDSIIQYGLEPEIYSLRGLKMFIRKASELGLSKYPVHIKLDTGMHRLGFEEEQLPELIALLENESCITVRSILSHMATSDDPALADFANEQIRLFERLSNILMEGIGYKPLRHLLNTSGISNFPAAQYDMVRLGIGLYGVSNDRIEQEELAHVGTLKSVISQLRWIDEGESVGYGRRFIASRKTRVATVPVGYADGIRRAWGNGVGYLVINGLRAPIIGSICMDMLMADCTHIECTEGQEVIILGENPSIREMAETLNTIPYEILTSISQRVKRIFYRE